MKILVGFCIFCVVLFLYLHIQFHLKTGEDLEMYEIEQPSKSKLEEICDLRQPVLFDMEECEKISDATHFSYLERNYYAFDIKIRKTTHTDGELYVPLRLHTSSQLFTEDKSGTFYSENNSDFLEETGVGKSMRYNDDFLRPHMVSNCHYDIIMGSAGVKTPFRYELNYRNYFFITQGEARVKLAPPHSIKYLYPIYDYENFEFRTPIDPWNPQPKYVADFDKIKCLEFALPAGKIMYIPAYWWYSIQLDNATTSIAVFRYRTYMNNLAILPYLSLHALQLQNVKRDVAKKVIASTDEQETLTCEPSKQAAPTSTFPPVNEMPPDRNVSSSITTTNSSLNQSNEPSKEKENNEPAGFQPDTDMGTLID